MENSNYTIQIGTHIATPASVSGVTELVFKAKRTTPETPGTLCFFGEAYAHIKAEILEKPNPQLRTLPVTIYDKCCPDFVIFDGRISGNDITLCKIPESCEVCIELRPTDIVNEKLRCLKNHIIHDRTNASGTVNTEGENTGRAAPYVLYCNNPDFGELFTGLFILAIGVPIAAVVFAIIAVINAIIDAINGLPGVNIDKIDFDGDDDTNAFQEFKNFVEDYRESITGCGRKHKAPFVSSYLQNACALCGLTLKSSLFEPGGTYYNTMRLDAAYERGDNTEAGIAEAWEANKPNLNFVQLLDSFDKFNIDWRVTKDCFLCVEHETGINGQATQILDMRAIDQDRIESFCIDYGNKEKQCAYATYLYAEDAADQAGNEVLARWSDYVINWNEPPSELQEGQCKVVFDYSAAQFRRDALRPGRAPIDSAVAFSFPLAIATPNALLLSKDKTVTPKLLMWDGTSPTARALVQREAQGALFQYNIPWRVHTLPVQGISTAYQNLLYSDDPRTTATGQRKYTLKVRATKAQKILIYDADAITIWCDGQEWAGSVESVAFDGFILTVEGVF